MAPLEFVTINGARLAYRICGPADGPLLITLHGGRGFGSHESDFAAYGPLGTTATPHRVLSFDYRGHGQSSATKPYTFAQLVADIDGMRRHFAGADARIVLCGGSFGGFLAQQYAIEHAESVSHLILRGTAASYHQEEAAARELELRLHKAPSFSAAMLRDKVFGRYESDLEFRLVSLAMSPLYSEHFDADAALAGCLEGVYNAEAHNDLYADDEKYFDYRGRLHKVTAKTLVIVGDRDWICPPEHSRLIVSLIPGAELFVVAGANHGVHIEKNAQVVAKIAEFLR